MGNTVILTKNHPSELGAIEKAEAYQISLLGGATGEQRIQEQHGWWNEQNQKAHALVITFAPEEALPFEEARQLYRDQIKKRASEGFVHARSYNFNEGRFVYRSLLELASMSFQIPDESLATIRAISANAKAAEEFVDKFVASIGGTKIDSALSLTGATAGGADYLFQNDIVAELKILEKDNWDDYNGKMDALFAKYKASGELPPDIDPEKTSPDDPEIPDAMRTEWRKILVEPIASKFHRADRQIAEAKKAAPTAQGILLLLNVQNRLHAEPSRLYWLVRDNILNGTRYPNIEAYVYFSFPVPELMTAGINRCIFWLHSTRAENDTPEGWKDQNLLMKCRGLEEQWLTFLRQKLNLPIHDIPASEIRWPKP